MHDVASHRLEELGCHPKAIADCLRYEPNPAIVLLAAEAAKRWVRDLRHAKQWDGWPSQWDDPEIGIRPIPFVGRHWRLHSTENGVILQEIDRRTLRSWLRFARDIYPRLSTYMAAGWLADLKRVPL